MTRSDDRQHALRALKLAIAERLNEIESLCHSRGVPLTRLTLIARDPRNDQMFVTVTNEPDEESLRRAVEVGLGPAAHIV